MQYLDELTTALEAVGLQNSDVCIVGSAALAEAGLRTNHDLDIAVSPGNYRRILDITPEERITSAGAIALTSNIQIGRDRYGHLGLPATDLFDGKWSSSFRGYRLVRLEVEFAHKVRRSREKDRSDVRALERMALLDPDWNWNAVYHLLAASGEEVSKAGGRSFSAFLRRRVPKRLWKPLAAAKRLAQPAELVRRLSRAMRRQWQRRWLQARTLHRRRQFGLQVHESVALGSLLQAQMRSGAFERFDVLLRWGAIDALEGGDLVNDAVKYYEEMQSARVGRSGSGKLQRFFDSIRIRGLEDRYPVSVSKAGRLLDGSHRLAAALHLDLDSIAVRRIPTTTEPEFGAKWFLSRGFPQSLVDELAGLRDRALVQHGVYTTMLLWPPVISHAEEIERYIEERVPILFSAQIDLGVEFDTVARRVYAIDDIDQWKVEVKLAAMSGYGTSVRFILLDLVDSDYRVKQRTGSYLSCGGAELKSGIRSSFRGLVPNYIYDIVCHTGDNHRHNRETIKILDPWLSFEDVARGMSGAPDVARARGPASH